MQTKEVLQAMLKDAKQPNFKLLRVDGGASRNNLLMQLQADAIQVGFPSAKALGMTCDVC